MRRGLPNFQDSKATGVPSTDRNYTLEIRQLPFCFLKLPDPLTELVSVGLRTQGEGAPADPGVTKAVWV